jgi:hypothetical protein
VKISDRGVPANRTAISGQIMAQLSTAAAALRSMLYGSDIAPRDTANTSLPISLSALTLAFTEIAQAQKILQNGNIRTPEVAAALAEYQHLLGEFKSNLPRFQGWLLAERARLARRSSHSAAVESWVETNRQTRNPNWPGHPKH